MRDQSAGVSHLFRQVGLPGRRESQAAGQASQNWEQSDPIFLLVLMAAALPLEMVACIESPQGNQYFLKGFATGESLDMCGSRLSER